MAGVIDDAEAWFGMIADRLERRGQAAPGAAASAATTTDAELPMLVALARNVLAKRRLRSTFFEEGMFGEPAFDILLDMFVNGSTERPLTVTDVCVGAGVAPTTGLRYVAALVEQGLIIRTRDALDGRRSLIVLSGKAQEQVTRYIAACRQLDQKIYPS